MLINELRQIAKILYSKTGIKINPENKGKFTEYCNGKVTDECIKKGLNSDNPTIRKRANFAQNARTWKATRGMKFNANSLYENLMPTFIDNLPEYSEQQESENSLEEYSTLNPSFSLMKDWSILDNYDYKADDSIPSLPEIKHQFKQNNFSSNDSIQFGNYGNKTETANYIRDYLSKHLNLTPEQAEGFVVNFNHESGFNTSIVAKPSTRGNKSYSGGDTGLAQWVGKRKSLFKQMFNKDLKDSTLDEQLQYVVWEVNNKFPRLKEMLNKTQTPEEASKVVMLGYEATSDNPGISDKEYKNIYVHSIDHAIKSRLKHAGYKI